MHGLKRLRRAALAAALLATVGTGPAAARDGDSAGVSLLGRYLHGLPRRVVVRDPVAFVALDTGLQVLDVTNPRRPALIASVYLPSPVHDLDIAGNLLYLAAGDTGLLIYDVANPAAPSLAGTFRTAGLRGIAVAGTLAYLAEADSSGGGADGLRIVDVSNPALPTPVSLLALPNGAVDVALAGSVALVALGGSLSGPGGLAAVDVSSPASPVVGPAGYLDLGEPANEIAVAGGIAYVASGFTSSGTFHAIDLASPQRPAVLASIPLCDAALGLSLSGGIAYVAASALGLHAFDIANPAEPRLLDTLPTGRTAVAAASTGAVTFLAERSLVETASLTAIDTASPADLKSGRTLFSAEATAAAAGPGLAYLLNRDALHILDTSSPFQPVEVGTWRPLHAELTAIEVAGSIAAVGNGPFVHLVDLGNLSQPGEISLVKLTQGAVIRMVLRGTTLYVVTGFGLEVFDLSSAAAPASIGRFSTPGWSSSLALALPYGYLAAGDTLHVIDLSSPSSPSQVGSLRIPGERLFGIAVDRDLAVMTGLARRLHTVSLAAPASPQLLTSFGAGPGFDIRLIGRRAVVAGGESGTSVLRVTDPANPVQEGYWDTSGEVSSIASDGRNLYLASGPAQHWLLLCDTCPACTDTWPTVASNSLRLSRTPENTVLSWGVAAGASPGEFNVHRTTVTAAIPGLPGDATTIIGFTASLTFIDPSWPAPAIVAHYAVFGRGSCSGESYGP